MSTPFRFKQFEVSHQRSAMKVGTDGVLLGAWVDVSGVKRALDIGAGSGLIALMVAQRQPDALVDAVEIDEQAAQEATHNMQASPWSHRLRCEHTSIQDFVQQHTAHEGLYDLIVSNPPFFTGGVLSEVQARQDVRHTVKLPHSDLLDAVRRLLHPKGRFCVILPLLEGLRFQEIAAHYHLYTTRLAEVSPRPEQGTNRLLLQLEQQPSPDTPVREAFAIYQTGRNEWTEAYRQLTREFYLNA